MRNSFIFYRSYFEAIDVLQPCDQVKLYRAIINYALNGDSSDLDGINKALFVLIKPTLDNSMKQYENGKKGGRPKKEKNPNETQIKLKQNPTHNPTNIDIDIDTNNNINNNNKFIIPTIEQVREYAISRGRLDLADKFFQFFDVGKWVDSKGNKVKNWKQKFLTWESHSKQQTNANSDSQIIKHNYASSDIDNMYDDVENIEI